MLVATTWVDVVGVPQPVAVAVMVVVPDHPAAKVTIPVAALMVFPPFRLAASRVYVNPVLFVAVAP